MTRILELNIAGAIVSELGEETAECFAVLGQGSALEYWANQVGRLQRRHGKHNVAVDFHLCGLARALSVADIAAKKLPFDKRADLLSFIVERGMNMQSLQEGGV